MDAVDVECRVEQNSTKELEISPKVEALIKSQQSQIDVLQQKLEEMESMKVSLTPETTKSVRRETAALRQLVISPIEVSEKDVGAEAVGNETKETIFAGASFGTLEDDNDGDDCANSRIDQDQDYISTASNTEDEDHGSDSIDSDDVRDGIFCMNEHIHVGDDDVDAVGNFDVPLDSVAFDDVPRALDIVDFDAESDGDGVDGSSEDEWMNEMYAKYT